MDWPIWILIAIVAMIVIGVAWFTAEQRRIESWRHRNREHANAIERMTEQRDDGGWDHAGGR